MARMPEFQPVYDAFDRFLNQCLLGTRSLLWPHEEAWTQADVAEVKRRMVDEPVGGEGSFEDKLQKQMHGASPRQWMIVCDIYYVYFLPSHQIRLDKRRRDIGWAAQQGGLVPPPESSEVWEAQKGGFTRTTLRYHYKYGQFWLLLLCADHLKGLADAQSIVADPRRMQQLLDDFLMKRIQNPTDRAWDMRHAMLYMAFPDQYERIISTADKHAIVKAYGNRIPGVVPEDLDEAIREIRKVLSKDHDKPEGPFDFYRDLKGEWRPGKRAGSGGAGGGPGPDTGVVEPDRDLDLERVLRVLGRTRNVILYGPPGTGKTYIARSAAAKLAGTSVNGHESPKQPAEGSLWWTAFHQSYAYEDFVEGLRPIPSSSKDGPPRYEVVPGLFRRVCEEASSDPAHKYVLVIDEINRGNIAKILGELITLLEDDKRDGEKNALKIKLPYSGESLSVPANLYIIGTMNTTDRSIALLDMALRRRFAFVELMPRHELLRDAKVKTAEDVVLPLSDLMGRLNARICADLDRDHQIGHSYFLNVANAPEEEQVEVLEFVWNHQIMPLLEEYYFGQRDKLAQLLEPFRTDLEVEEELGRLEGEDLIRALVKLAQRAVPTGT